MQNEELIIENDQLKKERANMQKTHAKNMELMQKHISGLRSESFEKQSKLNSLEKENKQLINLAYALIVMAICSLIFVVYQQAKITQYEKDIVMMGSDIAYRQHNLDVWIDFNKSYIPETALPRIKEIEAIYLKG